MRDEGQNKAGSKKEKGAVLLLTFIMMTALIAFLFSFVYMTNVRAKAAAALLACTRVDCMKSMAGAYREMTLKTRGDDEADGDGMEHGDVLRLDSEERKQEILTRPSGREPK